MFLGKALSPFSWKCQLWSNWSGLFIIIASYCLFFVFIFFVAHLLKSGKKFVSITLSETWSAIFCSLLIQHEWFATGNMNVEKNMFASQFLQVYSRSLVYSTKNTLLINTAKRLYEWTFHSRIANSSSPRFESHLGHLIMMAKLWIKKQLYPTLNYLTLTYYCICLVSIWWREYWQITIGWGSPKNLKKPSWILWEETYSGSY